MIKALRDIVTGFNRAQGAVNGACVFTKVPVTNFPVSNQPDGRIQPTPASAR
jgi:hypothetical protein